MAKSLKYKVNQTIGTHKIINIDLSGKNVAYSIQCKCGIIKITKSNNIKRSSKCCKICIVKMKTQKHIGKIFGKLEIIDNPSHILIAKCKCGNLIKGVINTLSKQKSCKKCVHGYFPGAILDGITVIKRLGNLIYEMKCHCGNIFQKQPRKYKGKYIDCGCSSRNKIDEFVKTKIGKKYKYLKVIRKLKNEEGHNFLEIRCVCGNIFSRPVGHEFKSESCGCKRYKNNPHSENKGNARFKNYEIRSIRELFDTKQYNQEQLSKMFGMDISYLNRILRRKIWKKI